VAGVSGGLDAAGGMKKKKQFFFEKKNQKTFDCWSAMGGTVN
jgi:hypothetical protein